MGGMLSASNLVVPCSEALFMAQDLALLYRVQIHTCKTRVYSEICGAMFWVMLHFDHVQAVWLVSGSFILLLKLCLDILGVRILPPSRGYTWICWLIFQEREAEWSWAVKDCFSLRDFEGDWPAVLSIVRYVHDFLLRKHNNSINAGLGSWIGGPCTRGKYSPHIQIPLFL